MADEFAEPAWDREAEQFAEPAGDWYSARPGIMTRNMQIRRAEPKGFDRKAVIPVSDLEDLAIRWGEYQEGSQYCVQLSLTLLDAAVQKSLGHVVFELRRLPGSETKNGSPYTFHVITGLHMEAARGLRGDGS